MREAHMREQRLHDGARAALDGSVAALPDDVLERLARARAHALDALSERDAGGSAPVPGAAFARGSSRWAPSFALAATILFAIGLWNRAYVPPLPAVDDPVEARAVQDMELLDELEFVAWMELQAQQGVDPAAMPGDLEMGGAEGSDHAG